VYRAVVMSFWSKGGSLILQFVALPLVARRLGPDLFGLYAIFSSYLGFASLLDLGIGPALAKHISSGVAKNDHTAQARNFQASIIIACTMSILLIIFAFWIHSGNQIKKIIGTKIDFDESAINDTFVLMIMLLVSQIITSVGMKARLGFQEVHIANFFSSCGVVLTALCLCLLLLVKPTVYSVLASIFGPPILAQVVNLVSLLIKRPYLLKRVLDGTKIQVIQHLLSDGMWYTLAIGLLAAEREIGKIVLGKFDQPSSVGIFAIFGSILNISGGILVTITSAIWPALTDAQTKNDRVWLNKSWVKVKLYSNFYALITGVTIAIFGKHALMILYGSQFNIPYLTFVLLGLYSSVLVVAHVRFTWILGVGQIRCLAYVAICEAFFSILLIYIFRKILTVDILLIVFIVSHLMFSYFLQLRLSFRCFYQSPNELRLDKI
jgi:O-antigen/teichoic acid export membrane protein